MHSIVGRSRIQAFYQSEIHVLKWNIFATQRTNSTQILYRKCIENRVMYFVCKESWFTIWNMVDVLTLSAPTSKLSLRTLKTPLGVQNTKNSITHLVLTARFFESTPAHIKNEYVENYFLSQCQLSTQHGKKSRKKSFIFIISIKFTEIKIWLLVAVLTIKKCCVTMKSAKKFWTNANRNITSMCCCQGNTESMWILELNEL